jgi:hypothetical protein
MMSNTWDIQVNLKVTAQSEKAAEQQVFDFFKSMHHQEYDLQFKIDEWEFMEFIPYDYTGCRDNN